MNIHTLCKASILIPANIDTNRTFLHETSGIVTVFRHPLTASVSMPGFTPRNIISQLQYTSPFLVVMLVPKSFQCFRLFKWGPDTQICDAGCASERNINVRFYDLFKLGSKGHKEINISRETGRHIGIYSNSRALPRRLELKVNIHCCICRNIFHEHLFY